MEGRHCFAHLTVEENLLTGAFIQGGKRRRSPTISTRSTATFPRLKERRTSLAGYTSGGEQQMVAIGRALMSRPSIVLLDEPSMGLAPQLVEEIFEIVKNLNSARRSRFLLAEQNTNVALRYAAVRLYPGKRPRRDGRRRRRLRENEDVKEFYLGLSATGRKRYRDVKFYRRRKRWL